MKPVGNILDPVSGAAEPVFGLEPDPEDPERPRLNAPVSMMFREAMIVSINHSWKRSTTSAHVSWKRFSFSNFLKTVDLISTN